jgi:hypothetical protein
LVRHRLLPTDYGRSIHTTVTILSCYCMDICTIVPAVPTAVIILGFPDLCWDALSSRLMSDAAFFLVAATPAATQQRVDLQAHIKRHAPLVTRWEGLGRRKANAKTRLRYLEMANGLVAFKMPSWRSEEEAGGQGLTNETGFLKAALRWRRCRQIVAVAYSFPIRTYIWIVWMQGKFR